MYLLMQEEKTKQALFDIGVGMFDNYENCSWETLGKGQFKPMGDANPNIGELNKLEVLEESFMRLMIII